MASTESPFALQFDPAEVVAVDGPRARAGQIGGLAAERLVLPHIDGPADAAPDDTTAPPAAAEAQPPRFTEDELSAALAAARDEARRETEAKVRAATTASIEHRQAEALATIARRLGESQAAYDARIAGCARHGRDLGLALARAIIPRALARAPLADIEAMLFDLVPRLHGQPRLELRVSPDLVEAGRATLARVAQTADYQGAIEVVADAALHDGDARLDWHHGAAERSLARLETETAALIEACLPGDEPDTGPAAAASGGDTEAHRSSVSDTAREEMSDD